MNRFILSFFALSNLPNIISSNRIGQIVNLTTSKSHRNPRQNQHNSQKTNFAEKMTELSSDLAMRSHFSIPNHEKVDPTLKNFAVTHNWIGLLNIQDYGCYCQFRADKYQTDLTWTGSPTDELDRLCRNFREANQCLRSHHHDQDNCDAVSMMNSSTRKFNIFPCDQECVENFTDEDISTQCLVANPMNSCQADACSLFMDFAIRLSVLSRNVEIFKQDEKYFGRTFRAEERCRSINSLTISDVSFDDNKNPSKAIALSNLPKTDGRMGSINRNHNQKIAKSDKAHQKTTKEKIDLALADYNSSQQKLANIEAQKNKNSFSNNQYQSVSRQGIMSNQIKCCGKFPSVSLIRNKDLGRKSCCGNKTYLVSIQQCCENGNVRLIGTC